MGYRNQDRMPGYTDVVIFTNEQTSYTFSLVCQKLKLQICCIHHYKVIFTEILLALDA